MTLTTLIHTAIFGTLVGIDGFGNRYYRRQDRKSKKERRWVMYKGIAEPSKVPAQWHGWLHYTQTEPPDVKSLSHHVWERPHLPNLTGTQGAYLPQGHLSKAGHHAPTMADYEPWKP